MPDHDLAERIRLMKEAAEKAQSAADITSPDRDYFAAVNNFQLHCGPSAVLALIALVEQQGREIELLESIRSAYENGDEEMLAELEAEETDLAQSTAIQPSTTKETT